MNFFGWLLVGVAGIAVGVLGAALVWRRDRPRATAEELARQAEHATAGVRQVLAALRSAAVLIERDLRAVVTNRSADTLGLVDGDRLAHTSVAEVVDEARQTGEVQVAELELPRRAVGWAAGTIVVQVRAVPLPGGQVLLVVDDLTAARQLESVRRDFVVNVSHELKTPVGALGLLAEAIEDAADDPEAVRRFARQMRTESRRLAALVQEIIELSRVQVSGSLDRTTLVEVDDVVAEAVDRARTRAEAQEIEIDVGGEREARVRGDRETLVTAVRNLLDNAVTYSEPGTRVALGVRIIPPGTSAAPAAGTAAPGRVATSDGGALDARAGVVEIAVVDQGIGISPADQTRVFERFYRVDQARSRDTGGTGLGLSIVKHVAAEHGGEVTLWSQPGQGSTFTLRLPAGRAADGSAPTEGTSA